MNFSDLTARLKKTVHDLVYGFVVLSPLLTIRKERTSLDFTFMTLFFGDILGLPLLAPVYKYKMLPYFFPMMQSWKENIMKEKDVTEKMGES